ncbi:hypothetical protein EVAR_100278_1 [Eumeta japonica]|uniref:Uncharacterized protein n=1 Tax=Eumeta variegata TaxID=151549 RepID=A0A4C2ABX4_EUMVA|nr:hypothetical protein EVAR_100278_1 [Eumeta japonica]
MKTGTLTLFASVLEKFRKETRSHDLRHDNASLHTARQTTNYMGTLGSPRAIRSFTSKIESINRSSPAYRASRCTTALLSRIKSTIQLLMCAIAIAGGGARRPQLARHARWAPAV